MLKPDLGYAASLAVCAVSAGLLTATVPVAKPRASDASRTVSLGIWTPSGADLDVDGDAQIASRHADSLSLLG